MLTSSQRLNFNAIMQFKSANYGHSLAQGTKIVYYDS